MLATVPVAGPKSRCLGSRDAPRASGPYGHRLDGKKLAGATLRLPGSNSPGWFSGSPAGLKCRPRTPVEQRAGYTEGLIRVHCSGPPALSARQPDSAA